MTTVPHTSYRLKASTKALLAALAEQLGVTRTAVIELAIRRLARTEHVSVPRNGQAAARAPRGEAGEG